MCISHRIRAWRLVAASRRFGDDHGMAMVLTIGVSMVLTITMIGLATFFVAATSTARRDQDWNGAVAAAQAGIDDYVSYLNGNSNIWLQPASALADPQSDYYNAAFAGWQEVSGDVSESQFHYQLTSTTAETQSTGLVEMTVSGKTRGVERKLAVSLRRDSFPDYVYWSDKEVGDTGEAAYYSSSYWSTHDPVATCDVYNWAAGFDSRDANCPKIWWTGTDTVGGRLHTNDAIYVKGHPTFARGIEEQCPDQRSGDPCYSPNQLWIPYDASSSPELNGYPATGHTPMSLPATNTELRNAADLAHGGTGCMYKGPTRIVLKANGKMYVHSPNTPAGFNTCGVGDNLSLPPNGVVYVRNLIVGEGAVDQDAPWVSTGMTVDTESSTNCAPVSPATSCLAANSAGSTYPDPSDVTSWGASNGDAFIEGTLSGQLTVATENNILITGDTVYKDAMAGTDVLGLVAQNFVKLYHPVNSSNQELMPSSAMVNPTINAAILSVAHSFANQNFNRGAPHYGGAAKGTIHLTGSLAQKFRGPVGTFSGGTIYTGYSKDYQYDSRLRWQTPPLFLTPTQVNWRTVEVRELPPG